MWTNNWIKVTDHLPTEDGVKVLVTVQVGFDSDDTDISLLYYLTQNSNDIAYSVFWKGEGFYEMRDGDFYKVDDIVAWMPLPEPFVDE